MKKPTATLPKAKSAKTENFPFSLEKSPHLIADNFSASELENFFQKLPADISVLANVYLKLQIEIEGKNEGSIQAVKNDLNKFLHFFTQYQKTDDIRRWLPRITHRFIENLEKLGQKPSTICRALISVRAFGSWAMTIRPDLFPLGNPTKGSKAPAQEPLRPKGLSEFQVKRLLDAAYHLICQNYPDDRIQAIQSEKWYTKAHRQMRRPFRDYAILMLLLNAGLRRSEICGLDHGQLKKRHLRNVKCKGNLYRDVLLGKKTTQAIRAYLKEERGKDQDAFPDSAALFLPSGSRKHRNKTGRLAGRTINFIVERIAKTANQGVDPEEWIKVHPHMFRHTHAYQVLKKGRSLPYLQKRLGHQSMNYLALYTQMQEEEEKKLIDNAEFE